MAGFAMHSKYGTSLGTQKKKKSLLGYSKAFFLKLQSASMKGSLGSSSRNSKFLKNLS